MKAFKTIIIILLIIVGGIGIYLGAKFIQENQGISDSDALFGGALEFGYPSAGYLVSYEPSGGSKTCGFSVINNQVALTAAHCVDNSQEIYIGKGSFSVDKSNQVKVSKATQKQAWVTSQERSSDFAILNFQNINNYFTSFSNIASPREGCDMRVVAYGRTENPSEIATKPRKSAIVCASEIGRNTYVITGKGKESGICFGDSGSPVYYNGTETLVGIVVSIILEDNNQQQPCDFGNRAIVVRVDSNQQLINENLATLPGNLPNTVSVQDGLTIEVANQTIWERIGLPRPSKEQELQYILIGAGAILTTLIIALIVVLLRPHRPDTPSWE